ncbi:MAG: TrkA family potassium uptake protein [Desulfurococcales archaeon]|nr:TrkA family potassium uptake protein [Desulfurococcales archaeon]
MRILVIGAGRVGSTLAERLSNAGHSVTVIDRDESKLVSIQADVESYVRDATDPDTYEELDVRMYDVIVAATDRDEVNLFVAAISKLYNIEKIYVRVKNPKTSRLLRMLDVEGIVVVPQLAANILYSMIEGKQRMVSIADALVGEFKLAALTVKETSPVRGMTPREVEAEGLLPKEAKIFAIYSRDRFYDPDEAPPLESGDVVILLLHESALEKIGELF